MDNHLIRRAELREGARAIKDAYVKSGLDAREFAKLVGISIASLKSYINLSTNPRPKTIEKVEKRFNPDQLSL